MAALLPLTICTLRIRNARKMIIDCSARSLAPRLLRVPLFWFYLKIPSQYQQICSSYYGKANVKYRAPNEMKSAAKKNVG